MKQFKIKPIALMIMGTSFLTACGTATRNADERFDSTKEATNIKYNESLKASAVAIANDDANKNSNFSKTNKNWINPVPLPRVEERVALPDMFNKQVSMTMPGSVNAVEILSEMQRGTGIKFQLAQDIYDLTQGQGKIVTATGGGSGSTSKAAPLIISDFVFRGTLVDGLNLLAAKANVSWKWTGTDVEIYRYETKTYNIAALAGNTNTSSNVDLKGDTSASVTGSSGGGSTGKSNSSVSRTASLTTWDEVKSFIVSQLSPAGTLAVLESAGTISIRDIPSVHKRLDRSITDLNNQLSKQVFLNVDVYSVNINESDNIGIDWNLAWKNADNSLGFINSVGKTTSASNTFNMGVLTGPFTGTKAVVSALSNLGKTSLVNQFSVTTLNGQPTPIASNRKQSYLAEVKVTAATSTSGATTELKAGEVTAGINMSVIPKIEPNGNILLEYSLNLSDIEDITTFTSPDGASSIQLPTSNLKSMLQRASLRSGQALVLSGFKQANSSNIKSGVGSPDNLLLGGKLNAGTGTQYLVITVTPYIANSNAYLK